MSKPNDCIPIVNETLGEEPQASADAAYTNVREEAARSGNEPQSFIHDGYKSIRIAILSNVTCSSLEKYFRALLLSHSIDAHFYIPNANSITTDILDLNSALYFFNPDVIFLLFDEHLILDYIPNSDLTVTSVKKAAEDTDSFVKRTIQSICQKSDALIVINTIPLTEQLLNIFVDYRSKSKISLYFSEINQDILKESINNKQVISIDSNSILQNNKVEQLRDERFSLYANMHFHESYLYQFANELTKIICAKMGLTKKCLVLDLDNTLWGGIIGDDGIEGIELGGVYEGRAFQKFQQNIKQLKKQGVLLAINSKNELSNVTEAFLNHPEMQLTLDDFVCVKANWQPKNKNIQEIAQELNLSTDSFVFVDDNQAECALIKKYHPEIETISLSNDPSYYTSELLSTGLFNKLDLTEEDLIRTDDYHAEEKRKNFSNSFENIEEYLFDLGIKLRIFIPTPTDILRISQITLRTNQFNLTGQKYSTQEIERLLKNDDWFIFGVETEDRFGKNGIVGAIFLENVSKSLYIRNFLLSCRVFSREIESAILIELLNFAKLNSFNSVFSEYIQTKKNVIVQDFYPKHGFLEETMSKEGKIFQHSLNKITPLPSWIKVTESALEKEYARPNTPY